MRFKVKSNTTKYTILFLIAAVITFYHFVLSQKSFVWEIDGYDQHMVALTYYGQWLRQIARSIFVDHTFNITLWNFSIGYGGDVLTTLNYYVIGDPLNLLSVLVPTKYTEFLYDILVIARLYLSGLFFMYFCKVRGYKNNGAVVGAIIYAFSTYAVFSGTRHPFFIVPMIFLPIILAGLEKIVKGEKPYVFIFGIMFCVLSNFYFFYMVALVTVLYTFFRLSVYFKKDKKQYFSSFAKIAMFSVVGVLLASFLFLPTLIVFLQDSRTVNGAIVPAFYELKYYQKLLPGIISQDSAGHWNVVGVSFLSLIGIYFSFIKKDIKKIVLFVLAIVLLLFPIFGSAINGFSYACNRWVWAFVFLCSFSVVCYWKDIISLKISDNKKLVVFLSIYFGLILILRCARKENVLVLILLMIVLLVIVNYFNTHKSKWNIYRNRVIVLFVLVGIFVNGFYMFGITEDNVVSEYIDSGEVFKSYEESVAGDIKKHVKDKSFYRYASAEDEFLNDYDVNMKANKVLSGPIYANLVNKDFKLDNPSNAAILFRNNGIGYFWSLGNTNIQNYLTQVENKEYCLAYYYGVDQRTILSSLSSVKYFITEENEALKVPYGYQLDSIFNKYAPNMLRNKSYDKDNRSNATNYYVYKNKYALPLGYTYDNTISEKDAKKYNGLKKEEIMLSDAIVEKPDRLTSDVDDSQDLQSISKVPFIIRPDDPSNFKIQNNKIVVKKANSNIYLDFQLFGNENLYLRFKGLDVKQLNNKDANIDKYEYLTSGEKRYLDSEYRYFVENDLTRIYLFSSNVNKMLMHYSDNLCYSNNRKDFIVNLGYSKDYRNRIRVMFDNPGEYSFDDIQLFKQTYDNYASRIKKLKKTSLKNVRIKENKVIGNISLDKKKLLCLNIPYSDGWTLKVDGKKTNLKKVNYMNCGAILKAGNHKIELTYITPGLIPGIVLFLIGLLMVVIIIIAYKVSRKNA